MATRMLRWLASIFIALTAAVAQAASLDAEISARLGRVREFREIREMAEARGLRLWLFGGTAAGFAHYVKWDLLRERGILDAGKDSAAVRALPFQGERFDYDFTNIYRSTQDVDLVIDGSPARVEELRRALLEKYGYFAGSKQDWDVRSLREQVGDKEPLLKNPDFLNQHTDSNSTGMIELTTPPDGEVRIRDLRDWDSPEPKFLRDVEDGVLHFYFSSLHETTPRFRNGVNPAILSVVRYFVKVFQFEMGMRTEDMPHLRGIIQAFDPDAPASEAVRRWMEKHGPKLVKNAIDVQYAWNVLETVGLREKLIAFSRRSTGGAGPLSSKFAAVDSFAWWLQREPLRDSADPRSRKGPGPEPSPGKTAGELGITTVTHETKNFLTYEAIRRSHKGIANVLASREGVEGELAVYGDGFYTRIGKYGATGSGFHIRFKVSPDAREGADFRRIEGLDYVVWLTRDKLRVIPESLDFSPLAAFEFLLDPANASEHGIRETYRRRLSTREWTPELVSEAERRIDILTRQKGTDFAVFVEEVLANPIFMRGARWVDWVDALVTSGKADDALVLRVFSREDIVRLPPWRGWVETLYKRGQSVKWDEAMMGRKSVLGALPVIQHHPDWGRWVSEEFAKGAALYSAGAYRDRIVVMSVLGSAGFMGDPRWEKWVDAVMDSGRSYLIPDLLSFVLSKPEAMKSPRWAGWVDRVTRGSQWNTARGVLSEPHTATHPKWTEWAEHYVNQPSDESHIAIDGFMGKEHAFRNPKWESWMEKLIADPYAHYNLAQHVLGNTHVMKHARWGEWVEKLIESGRGCTPLAQHAMSHWFQNRPALRHPKWPVWIETLIRRELADLTMMPYALPNPKTVAESPAQFAGLHPRYPIWAEALKLKGDERRAFLDGHPFPYLPGPSHDEYPWFAGARATCKKALGE